MTCRLSPTAHLRREAEDAIAGRAIIARAAAAAGLSVQEYLHRRAERARIRQRAEAVGLAYWPALAYGPRIDPTAYAVADRILARRAGAAWGEAIPDGTRSHGGWDSWGHYGLNAHDVAAMWYAAGCRDGGKYRLQVATGVVARKGDSLPWLRAYARGLRWLRANRIGLHVSRKAIAALGRLSPELRRAALTGLFGRPYEAGPIRIRDLNWDAVRRAQDILRGGSIRARAAMAGIKRACAMLGVEPYDLAAALAPVYPRLPIDLARRIALGESPVALSAGVLTRTEAHAWCEAGAPDIAGWLAGHLVLPAHRSVRVVRWLAHCRTSGRWDAVERVRTVVIPGGERRQYRALDVLDEVQDEDIITGRDSVDAVLRRAAERLGDAWLTEAMRDHRILAPLPTWAVKLPKGMRILRTPAELAREGTEMHHCVGGYSNAVAHGQCHILAISTRHGRSTVELRPDLTVAQHRGPENTAPARRNETLLRAWLARVATRKETRHAA